MTSPGVEAAVALDPYVVRVTFADGEIRDVDMAPILDGPVFAPLRDPTFFGRVTVDEYGETITWPNGADLDPEVLYGVESPTGKAPLVIDPSTPGSLTGSESE